MDHDAAPTVETEREPLKVYRVQDEAESPTAPAPPRAAARSHPAARTAAEISAAGASPRPAGSGTRRRDSRPAPAVAR